jgi:hypothetical protein
MYLDGTPQLSRAAGAIDGKDGGIHCAIPPYVLAGDAALIDGSD